MNTLLYNEILGQYDSVYSRHLVAKSGTKITSKSVSDTIVIDYDLKTLKWNFKSCFHLWFSNV